MKKGKISKLWIMLLVLMIFGGTYTYAASITGDSNIKVGDTFTLTFDFGQNVGAYGNISVSYDTNILEYVSGDSLNEAVWWDQTEASSGIRTKSYTFRAKKEGSTRVDVVSNDVVSANETMDELGTVAASKMITVYTPKAETTTPTQPNNNNTPSSPTASGNNYLRYLQISEEGLTPNFSRNITEYSLAVGENVSSIEVLARAEDGNARVQITGNDNIVDGDNKIQIRVTAPNGYYRIYTITVTKTADKEKSNAYLEGLIVEDFELDKKFQSEVLEYNIGEILSTVKKLNIVANTKDSNAKIEIVGADKLVEDGEGEVIIKVIAADGVTTKEYKIKYTVKKATEEDIAQQEMKDYLKNIQNSKSKKEIAILYLKYVWAAIKKNYLLVLMYLLILVELIQIIVLRRKVKRLSNDDNSPDDNPPSDDTPKEILKVENKEENKLLESFENSNEGNEIEKEQTTTVNIVPDEKVDLLQRPGRRGSVESKADGIKVMDLDKDEGPKDEIIFNIFENLNDEDIKKMLNDELDDEK